ncbi:hypothetical protein [Microcoleus sp. N3A4]|uniref:hypothetical protein n=1 Tax=Microcoleus sp. N3A4 TaxID=3055379 RepID=UPI002FD224A8
MRNDSEQQSPACGPEAPPSCFARGAAPALHVVEALLAEASSNQLSVCRGFTRSRRSSSF